MVRQPQLIDLANLLKPTNITADEWMSYVMKLSSMTYKGTGGEQANLSIEEFRDSLTYNQIVSKLAAVSAFQSIYSPSVHRSILVLGGWFGGLALLLGLVVQKAGGRTKPLAIDSVDMSNQATWAAGELLNLGFPETLGIDIKTVSFWPVHAKAEYVGIPNGSIVLNPSCEHFTDKALFRTLVSADYADYLILQSTNTEHETHISTSATLADFVNRLCTLEPDLHVVWALDTPMQDPDYSRFTVLAKPNKQGL